MKSGEQIVHRVCHTPAHNFNAHAEFTIIKEIYNKSLSKLKICILLEHRDDF